MLAFVLLGTLLGQPVAPPTEPKVTVVVDQSAVTVRVQGRQVKRITLQPQIVEDDEPWTLKPRTLTTPRKGTAEATFDRPRTDFFVDVTFVDESHQRFDSAGRRTFYFMEPIRKANVARLIEAARRTRRRPSGSAPPHCCRSWSDSA